MVTLFPNFTMALADPNMLSALQVQVQIVGAPQVPSSIVATLHYHIVYRIQDHAFNLSKHGSGDSLLITANTNDQPHCVHVPRQILRKELIKLLPEKWVTNYEKLHEHSQPIQSTKSQILSKGDGTTEIKFGHDHLHDSKGPPIFPTQLMMQPLGNPATSHDNDDPECCCDLCDPGFERKLIQSFSADGKPLYIFKDEKTGHCPWDLDCSCQSCVSDRFDAWIDGMDNSASKPGKKKTKKKSTQSEFYERWMNGDPLIGPFGEDNGKFIYLVDYSATLPPPGQISLPETNNFPPPSQPPDKKPPQESKSQKKPKLFP
ncbi:hypothetical protein J1N35_032442 [Gossypium stocksii]|uniref:Uncharacterized protein n=1 Tax=Gossypium stocksii TaxID=47602 RepID=A0A9D3V3I8_9ROSI|nr:hypothetical protein J1N35_032442 [Gossypium stocksii]